MWTEGFFYELLKQWFRAFYSKPQASVQVNGLLTPFFDLTRGVRQGCPLSPLLYIICAEVLTANVRKCPRIRGIRLPNAQSQQEIKISQYADDTTLCLTSEQSFKAVLDIYALYEKASGSKLNEGKSIGLWLGNWAGRLDQPIQLFWSSVALPCLGLTKRHFGRYLAKKDSTVSRTLSIFGNKGGSLFKANQSFRICLVSLVFGMRDKFFRSPQLSSKNLIVFSLNLSGLGRKNLCQGPRCTLTNSLVVFL